MRPAIPLTTVVVAFAIGGCGGGGGTHTIAGHVPTTTTTASQSNTPAALEQAVRSAVQTNAQLSSYVLWHNVVPSWATRSTSGPALRALRDSAAERGAQHLQIRTVSQRVAIVSIGLDPSYLSATAKVRESGSVVSYRRGHPSGHPRQLNEVAQVELHRMGSSPRFRVWKVGSTR